MLRRNVNAHRFAPRLVVMVKEPVAGRVKTRLARGIGVVRATAVYRDLVCTVAARLGRDPRWQMTFAVTPDRPAHGGVLRTMAPCRPQGPGDIGQRLEHIFRSRPPGPLIVIGTDIPGIMPADIAAGFRALGRNDAVIGPSDDGGFWLIGLSASVRRKARIRNVRWSTAHARRDTEANLARNTIAQLRSLDDIDTADDYAALRGLLGRKVPRSVR